MRGVLPRGVGAPPPPGLEPAFMGQQNQAGRLMCVKVRLLDDTVAVFHLGNKALGQTLFDEVCRHLNLLECDYFGLEFIDHQGNHIWLDKDKPIVRQVAAAHSDAKFYFVVKFYTPTPAELEEEYTRYLFSLQIRRDLASGDLLCAESTAALLAAYLVQAECGDWSAIDYPDARYLDAARFVPAQTANFQQMVAHNHSKLVGMSPGESDLSLLEVSRRCDFYGIKFHTARDVEGTRAHLAVIHLGIKVFHQLHCVATFSWAKIRKLSFKRRKLLLKLHADQFHVYKDTVEFTFESRNECKNFWKKCVEHHAFFRCAQVLETSNSGGNHRSTSSGPSSRKIADSNGGGGAATKLFGNTRGSSFRYHGRTQKQLIEYIRDYHRKREPFTRPLKSDYATYHSARAHQPNRKNQPKELDATTPEADRAALLQHRNHQHHHQCCQNPAASRSRQARSLPRRAPLNPLDDVAPACPPTWLEEANNQQYQHDRQQHHHHHHHHHDHHAATPALGMTGGNNHHHQHAHQNQQHQPPAYATYYSKHNGGKKNGSAVPTQDAVVVENRLSMTDTVVSKSLPDVANGEDAENKRTTLSAGPSGERLDEKQSTLTDDNISCDSYQLADHERCTRSEVGTVTTSQQQPVSTGLSAAQRRLRNRSAIAARAVHEAASRAVQIDGPKVETDYATLESATKRPIMYTASGRLVIRPTVISSGDSHEEIAPKETPPTPRELVVVVERRLSKADDEIEREDPVKATTTTTTTTVPGPLPGRILTTDELMITPDGIRAKPSASTTDFGGSAKYAPRPSSVLLSEGPVVDLAERMADQAAQDAMEESMTTTMTTEEERQQAKQEPPKRPQLISVQSVDQPDIEHQVLLDDAADDVPYTLTMRKLDTPQSSTIPIPPPRLDRNSAPKRLFEDETRGRKSGQDGEGDFRRLRRRVSLDLVARRRLPSPASFSSQDHSLSPCTPDAGDLFEYVAMMRRRSASNERVGAGGNGGGGVGGGSSSHSKRNDARRRTQPVRFELPDMMEESCNQKLAAESTPQLFGPSREDPQEEKKECRESADSDDVPLPPPPPQPQVRSLPINTNEMPKRGPPPAVPPKPVGLMMIRPGLQSAIPKPSEDPPFIDETPVKKAEEKSTEKGDNEVEEGERKKKPTGLLWTDF